MNSFESFSQILLIDVLTMKSRKGDPETSFYLGKILWEHRQLDAAKYYLDEASKRGCIEAEKFLNNHAMVCHTTVSSRRQ